MVKIVSIPLRMSTDAVRGNVLLALIVVSITLFICEIAYEVIVRIASWMVGKIYLQKVSEKPHHNTDLFSDL